MDDENPYAPSRSLLFDDDHVVGNPKEAYRDGKLLVARRGAVLPDRCLKCNSPAEGSQFKRTLSWHRPFWFLLVLISLLVYVLVYFLVRWKATITVGLCPHHRRRRAKAIAIGWLTMLAGLGTIVAAASVSNNLTPIGVAVGVVVLSGGIIGGMLGSRVLVPTRIDKHYVWLSHVSTDYLATFPEWVPTVK
jgi:hypothetical protein